MEKQITVGLPGVTEQTPGTRVMVFAEDVKQQHPSVPADTPRYALWCIRSVVREQGHHLGPAKEGMAVCRGCGGVMVDTDAYAYMQEGATDDVLGSFARPCGEAPYRCPGCHAPFRNGQLFHLDWCLMQGRSNGLRMPGT